MSLTRLALLAIVLIAPRASAQEDKAACRKSFEQAQTLRDEHKLTSAREQMLVCSRVCPAGFAKLCDGWIYDVDKALPSIVIRAVDEQGHDLVAAAAFLDGVAIKLDGKSVVVDPGMHMIRIEVKGRTPVNHDVVASEGEKNRVIVVTVPAPKQQTPPPVRVESSPPIAAYVVTGLGIASLGGFAYFGLTADARHDDLVNGCSKTASCSESDRDRVVRDWRIADAFLATSVVLVGVGTYLYLTHDKTVAVSASATAATFTITF